MFNLLKSAAHPEKITDPAKIKATYKHWRIRVLISMYLGYACFYLTRKSFVFVMPEMIRVLGYTKEQIGILGSMFYLMYGCSKFLSGMLSDKSNPRYFMAVGLIMTGVANILFGMSTSMIYLIGFWMLNGFFQGWGWPPCARLLTHWYSLRERGTWWGLWNTSHNVGGGLTPILVGTIFTATHDWRAAMYAPGVLALIIGVSLIYGLSDVPESRGLPKVEDYRNDHGTMDKREKSDMSIFSILYQFVLKNRYIWILAFSYVLVYVIRTALNDWANLYLTQQKGVSLMSADSAVAFFEVGGFFGSLIAGFASDRIFKGQRGQINVIYSVAVLGAILLFWFNAGQSFFINSACLFAIGFTVFGPQMLIGMAAAELSHREAAGTATGFVGLFGYIGAALSGFPVAVIMQHFGWHGFFVTMMACGVGSTLLLSTMWSAKR